MKTAGIYIGLFLFVISPLALVAMNSVEAAPRAAHPSYATEIAAAKILKSKCKSCDDAKIRAAVLKTESSKGPYAKAADLARDARKSLRH